MNTRTFINLASRAVVRNNCICYGRYVLNWGERGGWAGVFSKFLAKKGKDIRGAERGEFACGECDEFMRSYGTICGYSGCLPTRYSRKDALSSSESVLRHQEDCTSGVEQVAEQLQKSGKIWRPRVVPQPKGRINWILLRYSAQILPVLLDIRNAFAIISVGVEPPTNGREPDDFQPRTHIKRFFWETDRNIEAIRELSDKSGPKKIVAEVCWAPCSYKNAPREEAKRRLKGTEWSGWTGITTTLTGLDCTTPNSFNSLIPRLVMTLSFQTKHFMDMV